MEHRHHAPGEEGVAIELLVSTILDGDDCRSADHVRDYKGSVNATCPRTAHTPLTAAVLQGRLGTIRALAIRGADPLLENGSGVSPLREAASVDNGSLQVLLSTFPRMELDGQDSTNGNTALHRAAFFGHLTAVKALLGAGCSTGVVNRDAMTPDQVAREAGFSLVGDIIHAEHLRRRDGASGGPASGGPAPKRPAQQGAPLNADDAFAITTAVHKLFHSMDSGDSALFTDQFTEDGVCDIVVTGGHAVGKAQLADLYDALHRRFADVRHHESNVTIDGRGNHATNYSYWTGVRGGDIVSSGVHEDRLVRCEDGVWRVAHRVIRHTYRQPEGIIPVPSYRDFVQRQLEGAASSPVSGPGPDTSVTGSTHAAPPLADPTTAGPGAGVRGAGTGTGTGTGTGSTAGASHASVRHSAAAGMPSVVPGPGHVGKGHVAGPPGHAAPGHNATGSGHQ